MRVNSNDQGSTKQEAKAALLRHLAVIEGAVPNVRRSVHQDMPATWTIVALQKIRRDIGAFEVALIEARLQSLAAGATRAGERRRVMDLAPLIVRQAAERSRQQGRMKWSSN